MLAGRCNALFSIFGLEWFINRDLVEVRNGRATGNRYERKKKCQMMGTFRRSMKGQDWGGESSIPKDGNRLFRWTACSPCQRWSLRVILFPIDIGVSSLSVAAVPSELASSKW